MKTVIVSLSSISPYSQSRHFVPERGPTESLDEVEKRTWRERLHSTPDGRVFIPPMAFKNSLSEAAKYLSESVPGKGSSKFTKHFEAGVLVIEPLVLPVKAADVPGEWLFVPADGRRGGGKRVNRCFPLIQQWSGDVTFLLVDDAITQPVFERHLTAAGNFIGVGRFRPRNNGYYGRFKIDSIKWDA